jgi:hypothetical protein
VIFFKKVNKRSIVNYENENFHKYLLDFKEKLTTDKNVRVSYRRKNYNMGTVSEMRAQMDELRGMMRSLLENKKAKKESANAGTKNGGNSIEIAEKRLDPIFNLFVKKLAGEGYIKVPLEKRNADVNGHQSTPDKDSSSISGPNLTLWKLKELKAKIAPNNFVVGLPNLSSCACVAGGNVPGGTPNNTWDVNDVNNITANYNKLLEVVNELKDLLAVLEIK